MYGEVATAPEDLTSHSLIKAQPVKRSSLNRFIALTAACYLGAACNHHGAGEGCGQPCMCVDQAEPFQLYCPGQVHFILP